jgi:hypothetical protein
LSFHRSRSQSRAIEEGYFAALSFAAMSAAEGITKKDENNPMGIPTAVFIVRTAGSDRRTPAA